MARFILLLILMYVVASALRRLLRGIADGMGSPGAGAARPPATSLVRDPICGTFVVPSNALRATRGSEVCFFCSDKCRQAWVSR